MIYICGDTHGLIDFDKLKNYFERRYASEKDVLIILGDAGIVWGEEDCSFSEFSQLGPTILFIDGNHENFPLLNRFPVVDIFGGKAHYLHRRIYHILRGEMLNINGLSFLCLGGATSIDKEMRTPGVSWWPEENITKQDMENALENAGKMNGEVDYVLTHCAPSSIVEKMFGYLVDRDTRQLEILRGRVSFKHWFFGHYHEDKKLGKFRCFYNEVLEVPAMDIGKRKIPYHLLECGRVEEKPFLNNSLTGRSTKITIDDLPEWFYRTYGFSDGFCDLSGVQDVAFKGSPFDNHLDKDSCFYLSYKGKLPKSKDFRPKKIFEKTICVWDVDLERFVLGLEKYSPRLRLDGIKAQINLTYDQYQNNTWNYRNEQVTVRPFPNIKTPRYQNRLSKEIANYEVLHGDTLLSTFIDMDVAIEYAETYILRNLCRPFLRYEEGASPIVRRYDTGHDMTMWVTIRIIEETAG